MFYKSNITNFLSADLELPDTTYFATPGQRHLANPLVDVAQTDRLSNLIMQRTFAL